MRRALILALLLSSAFAAAQLYEHRWTRTDNSHPAYGQMVRAWGDACYSAYVDGKSVQIVKYLLSGDQAWKKEVTPTNSNTSFLRGMAVTAHGVYIAVSAQASSLNGKSLLIGYDHNGNALPASEFSQSGNSSPTDLAADSAGSLYLLGYTYTGSANQGDIFVQKFDYLLRRHWFKNFKPETTAQFSYNIRPADSGSSVYFTQGMQLKISLGTFSS